jgi:hypothetical protein
VRWPRGQNPAFGPKPTEAPQEAMRRGAEANEL